MKDLLKGVKVGAGISLVLALFLSFSYLSRADFTGLKASGSDSVLTQSVWNDLVERVSGFTTTIAVSTVENGTDLSDANVYTINHNLGTKDVNVDIVACKTDNSKCMQVNGMEFIQSTTSTWRWRGALVYITDENNIELRTHTAGTASMQQIANDPWDAGWTAGTYKVVVKKI